MFSLYATADAYIAGVSPIITYPGYIPYSMSQVPLEVVETSSFAAGLFPGFTRVTTAGKTSVTTVTSDRSAIVTAAQASVAASASASIPHLQAHRQRLHPLTPPPLRVKLQRLRKAPQAN